MDQSTIKINFDRFEEEAGKTLKDDFALVRRRAVPASVVSPCFQMDHRLNLTQQATLHPISLKEISPETFEVSGASVGFAPQSQPLIHDPTERSRYASLTHS